jgi:hypothetical protein
VWAIPFESLNVPTFKISMVGFITYP